VDFTNRECDARNAIAAMIYAGVFERYPKLRVGVVEFEVAWAPYFLGRLDNVYTERAVGRKLQRFKDGLVPSDFFRRNVFISFQEDDLGVQLRSIIGVQNLMWGSDYPHAESTFPKSRQIVECILQDLPEEEKAMIAGANAARLYHFH
jgi:predicted TIM-barrel fold metal-dependent hydrolase